jgi:hypothetical protein
LPELKLNITISKQIYMELSKFLWNTATLALGGSVVAIVAYYMVRNDIADFLRTRRNSMAPPTADNTLLQMRLQAHERMIIYIDRINPANLLLRLHQSGLEVGALQMLAISEVKVEFQHNITQQLYLDPVIWDVVRKLKDDTIAMINNAVLNLPLDRPASDLSKKVLNHMTEIEENPYELTIGLIKQNIGKLF